MYSHTQCEIAKQITGSRISDNQINVESATLSNLQKQQSATAVERLVRLHDMPFDKGWAILKNDFCNISSEFFVDPATLFCIYMDYENGK